MNLVLPIICAGALGGSAYCLLNFHPAFPNTPQDKWSAEGTWTFPNLGEWCWRLLISVALGVTAAFTVPVFLHATSSDLIQKAVQSATQPGRSNAAESDSDSDKSRENDSDSWYVFFGFCVLAGYSAQRFLQALLDRVLKELEEQKKKVAKVEATANSAKMVAERVENDLTEPEPSGPPGQHPEAMLVLENPHDVQIMRAFHQARRENQWIRRSVQGLSKDTGLDVAGVEEALERLRQHGLVEQRSGRGRVGWLLTPTGLSWNL